MAIAAHALGLDLRVAALLAMSHSWLTNRPNVPFCGQNGIAAI
jgi:hypothetical protein